MGDIYIVDLGSRTIKFGNAGDEKPSLTIPHIYAKNGSFGLDGTLSLILINLSFHLASLFNSHTSHPLRR